MEMRTILITIRNSQNNKQTERVLCRSLFQIHILKRDNK